MWEFLRSFKNAVIVGLIMILAILVAAYVGWYVERWL